MRVIGSLLVDEFRSNLNNLISLTVNVEIGARRQDGAVSVSTEEVEIGRRDLVRLSRVEIGVFSSFKNLSIDEPACGGEIGVERDLSTRNLRESCCSCFCSVPAEAVVEQSEKSISLYFKVSERVREWQCRQDVSVSEVSLWDVCSKRTSSNPSEVRS